MPFRDVAWLGASAAGSALLAENPFEDPLLLRPVVIVVPLATLTLATLTPMHIHAHAYKVLR